MPEIIVPLLFVDIIVLPIAPLQYNYCDLYPSMCIYWFYSSPCLRSL